MSEELWGPWIEHDGNGFPGPKGGWFQVKIRRGDIWEGMSVGKYNEFGSCWDWASVDPEWHWKLVIGYRIRKPRGLTILEDLLENLPAPTSPKVDA